jgi:hypothetical protein
MTNDALITVVICSTVILVTLVSGITTAYVAKRICDAVKVVFPNQQLPRS